uniref:ATP-dependent RNA helicase DDX4-like n=2 Tax=Myxine glutinosa TaxID=7769 RepID=UPI00358F3AC0
MEENWDDDVASEQPQLSSSFLQLSVQNNENKAESESTKPSRWIPGGGQSGMFGNGRIARGRADSCGGFRSNLSAGRGGLASGRFPSQGRVKWCPEQGNDATDDAGVGTGGRWTRERQGRGGFPRRGQEGGHSEFEKDYSSRGAGGTGHRAGATRWAPRDQSHGSNFGRGSSRFDGTSDVDSSADAADDSRAKLDGYHARGGQMSFGGGFRSTPEEDGALFKGGRSDGGGMRSRGPRRGRGRAGGDRDQDEDGQAPGEPSAAPRPARTYVPPPPPSDEAGLFSSYSAGINFEKYFDMPVEITGTDPPIPIQSFDKLGMTPELRANVERAGYSKLTPIQQHTIPAVQAGRDIMGCAQTGSGKTAAFLLPILSEVLRKGDCLTTGQQGSPVAVVLAPTRELAIQIYHEAVKFSFQTVVRCVVVYGGTSVPHQLMQLRAGCHVLCGTPGRLNDFIRRGAVKLDKVKFWVLDEADRMLDMGFEPEVRALAEAMPPLEQRVTMMFSATFPPVVQDLARLFLRPDYLFVAIGRVGSACRDVVQRILQMPTYEKRDTLVKMLTPGESDCPEGIGSLAGAGSRTLIFTETKKNADFLGCYLCLNKIPSTTIHGDREQPEREQALADFRSGRFPVLVATSVAARGLDIGSVSAVVNYDLPTSVDEYVHRIGRTARCGNIGAAISFVDPQKDGPMAEPLVHVLAEAHQEVPEWLQKLAEGNCGLGSGQKFSGGFDSRDSRNLGSRGKPGASSQLTKGDFDYAEQEEEWE